MNIEFSALLLNYRHKKQVSGAKRRLPVSEDSDTPLWGVSQYYTLIKSENDTIIKKT